MMWVKRLCMAFLLVLLLLGSAGSLSADQTSTQYEKLLKELTAIWSEVNSLSVSSSMTLADIQTHFPSVLQKLVDFEAKLVIFETSLEDTYQKSQALEENLNISLAELLLLRTQFNELSSSIETLRISFTNIEDSVEKAVNRSNAGLAIAIVGTVIASSLAAYAIYNKEKD